MRAESTKKALTAAYEQEIAKAFSHLVDALHTAGAAPAERRAAEERFTLALMVSQDAYARALELMEGVREA